ncbi:MAG TPA: hypothetical protein VGX78_14065 [Pirellulales bacterium]|nr:hypothetical protein [Pirellulales bacterium]
METMLFAMFCAVVVALGAVWSTLGYGSAAARLATVAFIAVAFGSAIAYGFTSPFDRPHLVENCQFVVAVTLLQGAIVVGSLLVPMRLGYRLHRS